MNRMEPKEMLFVGNPNAGLVARLLWTRVSIPLALDLLEGSPQLRIFEGRPAVILSWFDDVFSQ
jgi:hypothetical protein